MKRILLVALGFLGLSAVIATALLQFGILDFAADTPHSPAVHRLIEWARERSIARGTAAILPPADLSDAGRIRRGAGNYDAMCVNCHLGPGMEDSEIRKGLNPAPPNLSKPTEGPDSGSADARRFWIIKHGVKGSGMPAWSKGGMDDESIWDLTAFLKVMSALSPEAYRRQVHSSDGHSHAGMDGSGGARETKPDHEHRDEATPHSHEHDAHQH